MNDYLSTMYTAPTYVERQYGQEPVAASALAYPLTPPIRPGVTWAGYGQGGGMLAGGAMAGLAALVGTGMAIYGLWRRHWGWGLGGAAVAIGGMVIGGGTAWAAAGQRMSANRAERDAAMASHQAAWEAIEQEHRSMGPTVGPAMP